MAQKTINSIIVLKNGQTAGIAASEYVASKGEPIIDIQAKKIYIGDGTSAVKALTPYNDLDEAAVEAILENYVKNTDFATTEKAGIVKADGVEILVGIDGALSIGQIAAAKIKGDIAAKTAEKLHVAREIAQTGDVTWSVSFDGSQNVTGEATLASVGTADTYVKVTTDAKGRVVSGEKTITAAEVTGLGALATKDKVAEADLDTALGNKIDEIATAGGEALKGVKSDGNTIQFYTDQAMEGSATFTIDLPEEYFLDQTKTVFVEAFTWSAETYPGSTNPELDGKPVLVLAVKSQDGSEVTYSFINLEKMIDVYTGGQTQTATIAVSGNEITATVRVSATAGNQIVTNEDGLFVAKTPDASAEQSGLMTAAQFTKLAGIAEGAQKNVNADWNAVEGDAQILNKPTQVSAFANDAHYLAYEDGVDTLVLNGGTIANPGA